MDLLNQSSQQVHLNLLSIIVNEKFELLYATAAYLQTTNISSNVILRETAFYYNEIHFTKSKGIISIKGFSTSFDITDESIAYLQTVLTELINKANYLGLLNPSLN